MDAHDSHAAVQLSKSFTNGFLFSLVARETTMDSPETPTATAATNKAMTASAAQDKLADKLVA
jgi:hypothetical protein